MLVLDRVSGKAPHTPNQEGEGISLLTVHAEEKNPQLSFTCIALWKNEDRCLACKQCSASGLNCRYLNPHIKLKLTELAIQLY